jgi:hypothetical protein
MRSKFNGILRFETERGYEAFAGKKIFCEHANDCKHSKNQKPSINLLTQGQFNHGL